MLTETPTAVAQDMVMPGADPMGMDQYGAPVTEFGEGSFFSQDLGTMLRLKYSTESYGQNQHGNFDIGSMQVITLDNAIWFVDGQLTLNDKTGAGYNIGVGHRWLSFPSYAPEAGRVGGVSVWADGQQTDAGNFYPQIGLSLESLGEMWDFRGNGYLPLGPQDQVGDFVPTGRTDFFGNSIAQLTQAVQSSSFAVAELEAARRLGPERDAWAFAGPYFVGNEDDDSAGVKAGMRGYAYPDLLLQFAVSNDEIFETNASFSVVWFVGRTRTDYRPACNVADRMREPVLRNDYVALEERFVAGGIPLTRPDGSPLRIVHVDSNAPAGGDGTFENPYDMLSDINGAGSLAGDIIFAHSASIFTGDITAILKNEQRLLGEGDNFIHTVATAQQGIINIPQSSPGARALDRPLITAALGDAVQATNDTEISNFDFENINGNAITATNVSGDITMRELSVTGGTDFAIALTDIEASSLVTLDEFTYDGEAGAAGGILFDDFDGVFNGTDSTLTNGTRAGVRVTGISDGIFTFANTFTLESIDNTTGAAFEIDGFTGQITMNGTIENIDEAGSDVGRAVSIQNMSLAGTSVTFGATADITHTSTGANEEGIFIANNTNGTVTFSGDLILTTTGSIAFDANESGNDVTLTASSANNLIDTTNAIGLRIVGTQIGSLGVTFPSFDADGGTNGAVLTSNTGGPITIGQVGDDAGQSGAINSTGDAFVINNSANVTVSGLVINNAATSRGVVVTKTNTTPMTVNLNDLQINNGTVAVDVDANNTTGNLNMTINDTDALSATVAGLRFNEVDAGTISVNNATVDGNNADTDSDGIVITNSNATFNFDAETEIREVGDTDFEVGFGSAIVSFAGDIFNNDAVPTGRSVDIHNTSGANITFTSTSSIDDDNLGVIVRSNSTSTVSFQGTYDLDTGNNDALTVTDNASGTYTFNNFDITTINGDGVNIFANAAAANITFNNVDVITTGTGHAFNAVGPGTLNVTGNGNTLRSATGTTLQIQDMTIGASLVAFSSVDTNGATNAIRLLNLTGGQVSVGNVGGAQNSGGTLTTTGDAIVVSDVANVDLRNIRVANAGGKGLLIEHTAAATTAMDVTLDNLNIDVTADQGIDTNADNDDFQFRWRLRDSDLEESVTIDATGRATVFLLIEDTDITTAAGTNDNALAIGFSGNARNGEITIRDNNNFRGEGGGRGMYFESTGTDSKTINLLIEDSNFFSDTNAVASAEFISGQNTTLNATIEGNVFDSQQAGADDFNMRTETASGRIRLKLGDTVTADMNSANGQGTFLVREVAGDFDIFEVTDTFAGNRNNGTVVPLPNAGAFDNLPTEPPLPILP